MGLLGVLVGMRLPKVDLARALERDHMIEEIWKESSFAEAVADILRPQLEAEGERKGERKMARRMAQIALEKRFGPLSDDVLAAIQAADEATLEEVVGSNTLEEARTHLGLS
jgi:hypothetical protein